MRLDQVHKRLLADQLDYYDRMYTLSSGIENGWPKALADSRREFVRDRFDILKKPFVEGIPRYDKDATWTWDNLSDGYEGKDKEELDELAELLGSYSKWTPYPHQIESVRAWQQGKHVVVATGTGSGKTECFLYPMLGQLLRESKRAKKRNEVMQRGVKAIVLYPMNALVADQTVRIRDLFGTLEMSTKLHQKGAGRPCQFGMYTGRTPAHGWYSMQDPSSLRWNINQKGPKPKVAAMVKAYTGIEKQHPALWKRLVEDRRIPAKGGHWKYDPEGEWTVEEIPYPVEVPAGIAVADARFTPVDDWNLSSFEKGMHKTDQNGFKKAKIEHLGTDGDRELYARYEMHQGGLLQYALQDSDPSEEARERYLQATQHLGVPDILVTNYSMLEYMLLRPLEHVFWEDTKTWLHEEPEADEPPRKLLLVLDEAHLYQGAMGTEVSMLLHRLRSVLTNDGAEPDIQVIITSASLGKEDEMKQKFAAELTGVNPEDVVAPKPSKTDLLKNRDWDTLSEASDEAIEHLSTLDAGSEKMEQPEYQFLKSLCSSNQHLRERLGSHINSPKDKSERMQLRYEILHDNDLFIRLYTALQHPSLLPANLHSLRPHGEKSAPWKLGTLAEVVFGQPDENLISRLLDLIAGARSWVDSGKEGMPLMPIRGHLFARGMPQLSVCPKCASFHQLDTLRCTASTSDGAPCGARPFELVYGRGTGVAFLNLWVDRMDAFEGRDGLTVSTGTQFAWSNAIGGSSEKNRVALASWRCTREHNYTHILDMMTGFLTPRFTFDEENFDETKHACLKVAGFKSNGNFESSELWQNQNNKQDNQFFDRICPETERNHSQRKARQVSNLQTRGNEAFGTLIDGLMQEQDEVEGAKHLPNSGKKCLVFSDSRQQAANIAVELGELSNHDETRRLLFEMLSEEWFQNLPSEHKSISGMFPWFALFCASKGMNPFSGGDLAQDRTVFAAAGINALASLLAARAAQIVDEERIEMSQFSGEIETLINGFKPRHMVDFNLQDIDFSSRKGHIEDVLNVKTPSSFELGSVSVRLREEISEIRRATKMVTSVEGLEDIVNEFKSKIDEEKFADLKIKMTNLHTALEDGLHIEIPRKSFLGIYHQIISKINDEWLLSSTQMAPLSQVAIKYASDEHVLGFLDEWNYNYIADQLPRHSRAHGRWTDAWAKFMVKFLFDGEYGVEEIGLGYVQINDCYWDKIDERMRIKFPEARYFIPRMFSKSFKGRGSSKIQNAVFSQDRMPAFNPFTIKQADEWAENPPGLANSSDLDELVLQFYAAEGLGSEMHRNRLLTSLKRAGVFVSMGGYNGLNADALEVKPSFFDEIRICKKCYRPRLTPIEDKTKCGACEESEFISGRDSEFSKRYQNLRIDPWRKNLQILLDGDDNISLLRVEEHTAQVGDKLDRSDLYSPAELHELQFQDIPVPDSTSVSNARSTLPPIDVLSCTTTMEVGIDIGSLTCVALRSMPPHSANYQQRIGRAGRGAAEVSIALTWADNSAYAQQLYELPERLIHHPDTPPVLYMGNRRILQRHFHASLLQLFMKHRPYDRDLLLFDGMEGGNGVITPSMVESLGFVQDFFYKENHPFGFKAFSQWVGATLTEDYIRERFPANIDAETYRSWAKKFVKWLDDSHTQTEGR
jgi:Lhr-like helicase